MEPEDQIGRRLAELRQQQGYRQEDFLKLLQAQGVDWTQATLSRVEGGKRPIRLTEAFAISDALGIDPKDLGPDQSGIGYRIEALKLQLNRLKENASEAISRRDSTRDGIAALRLADELRKDSQVEYVAHGTPDRFIQLLSKWITPNGVYPYQDVLAFLGGSESFERDGSSLTREDYDQYLRAFKSWLSEVLQERFPNLKFTGDDSGRFSVPGLTESLDAPGPLPPMGTNGLAVHLGIDRNGG
ncbi:helix-turn-helix transcriptional regulator [Rhodococcus erythropolis]|uniref:helix-turn-helix domain-containing protein n=1 Tax=Rhodococcus erythropolis TaxID=1833 RepID=UPI0033A77A13